MEIKSIKRNPLKSISKLDSLSMTPVNRDSIYNPVSVPNRSSLSPSSSEKYLKLKFDYIQTENSQSISCTPRTTTRSEQEAHKPISLVIIEKYFSDICHSIATKGTIDLNLLAKANTMQDVLKDCLTAVNDLSLQFYVLMASALKEIQQIHMTSDESLYSGLSKKLLQLAALIEENKYTSNTDRAVNQTSEEIVEVVGLKDLSKELNIRISRVTARILNIWKKILCPQREAAVISCSFLLLYCEIDPSIKISPNARVPIDKAIVVMKHYLANPGYVVTILRKTQEYIDKEMISVETIRRINDLLSKVTVEQVKTVDKTLTGLAIYDLINFAVKYYREYAKTHYKIDVFEKTSSENLLDTRKSNEKILEIIKTANKDSTVSILEENKNNLIQTPDLSNLNTQEIPKKVISHPIKELNPQIVPKVLNSPKKKTPVSSSIKHSPTQQLFKPNSTSPIKSLQRKPNENVIINSPKPLDKNIIAAKKLITSTTKNSSQSGKSTPVRTRKSVENPRSSEVSPTGHRDVLEEMQYHQFIEEKFRHFLIDKLKQETEKLQKTGIEKHDIKVVNEIKAIKFRKNWIEEFEKITGVIRFNATKKLSEEKRYTAELIRAQRQLDMIQRYSVDFN